MFYGFYGLGGVGDPWNTIRSRLEQNLWSKGEHAHVAVSEICGTPNTWRFPKIGVLPKSPILVGFALF